MGYDVRRIRAEDLPDVLRCASRALGLSFSPDFGSQLRDLLALDGSFLAEDRGQVVGVACAYRFGLSTSGPEDLSAAGTTIVGVLPTHRRRGVLRALMTRHLDWAREVGFDAVGLWASEPAIYPRFGFGLATHRGGWTIDVRAARPETAPPSDVLRYEELEPASQILPAVYDLHRADRPGALTRSPDWWRHRRWLEDPARRGAFSLLQFVVARRDGTPTGYVQFRRQSRWDEGRPADIVQIEELVGDSQARRALWRFLLGMDLVSELRAFNLPVDDVVPWLLGNRRYAQLHIEDALWLLPLDPARLLSTRPYGQDGAARLRLESPAPVTLELEVAGGRAACRPTRGDPQVCLQLQDLPGLTWGDVSPAALLEAGRLEGAPEAVRALGQLLATPRRPWCPERF